MDRIFRFFLKVEPQIYFLVEARIVAEFLSSERHTHVYSVYCFRCLLLKRFKISIKIKSLKAKLFFDFWTQQ